MKLQNELLHLNQDDTLIITVGSLEHNIIPEDKDLVKARKFFQNKFGKNRHVLIVPPIYSFSVLRPKKSK